MTSPSGSGGINFDPATMIAANNKVGANIPSPHPTITGLSPTGQANVDRVAAINAKLRKDIPESAAKANKDVNDLVNQNKESAQKIQQGFQQTNTEAKDAAGHATDMRKDIGLRSPIDGGTKKISDLFTSGLYGSNGKPHPEDVQQGQFGDCYFLAALQAIADKNPQRIMDGIKDNGDGTYDVRIYDERVKEWIHIDSNDVKDMLNIQGQQDQGYKAPYWSMLYQTALHKLEGKWVMDGGSSGEGLMHLEGIKDVTPQNMFSSNFSGLQQAINDGKPVVIGTNAQDNWPLIPSKPGDVGLVGGHAYAVHSVYQTSDGNWHAQLYNPWGYNYTHGETGDLIGNPVDINLTAADKKNAIQWWASAPH